MTDAEFIHAFETCTLNRREWTHAAHLRMAYLRLQGRTLAEALPIIREGIRRYNASHGNHTGYNETLTVAFAEIVAECLNCIPSPTFSDFQKDHPTIFAEGMGYLKRYYSEPVWQQAEAKENFIAPDLAGFRA